MDPALQELAISGDPDDELEAILRLKPGACRAPAPVSEITHFGEIRTIRLKRSDIRRVWNDACVASLKAARVIETDQPQIAEYARVGEATGIRRPVGLREKGRGVVVGVVDWGFDVAHPAFRNQDGSTRILALWDQRTPDPHQLSNRDTTAPYGYGRSFSRREIEISLRTPAPYEVLDYHPGEADRGQGAHGTHVADIAAGTPRTGGQGGVAPGADLVFVHLAAGPLSGLADLGDSVRILEAIDFIARVAKNKPLVINLSMGRHGGSKVGKNLLERALDRFVEGRLNTQIVQSAGNYYLAAAHASGVLWPGRTRQLTWRVARSDTTDNELEIWYSNRDRFNIALIPPGGQQPITARLSETRVLYDATGREIGRIYHRAFDPNSPDHHIDVFLYKSAPSGAWHVQLTAERVRDGRFHAWIERDPAGRRGQSRFAFRDIDRKYTIGSICTGFNTISVGAAEVIGPFISPPRFTSSGPTRDGRMKPDVVAPGVRERAARNAPLSEKNSGDRSTVMSGASQAAPYVAGTVALCLEAGNGLLDAHELRHAVIGTAMKQPSWSADDALRMGAGFVDIRNAVRVARAFGLTRARQMEDAS